MKTLLLNLPNREKVIRRARCSYRAFGFCYPPLELLYLGGILKKWKHSNPVLLDAIAEKLCLQSVLRLIKKERFDLIVCILGFEHIDDDIQCIKAIKKHLPASKIIGIGYLSTILPEEVLKISHIDILLLGEPEVTFSELYDRLASSLDIKDLKGVAYKKDGKIIVNDRRERIKNLDMLPFPPRELLKSFSLYNGLFTPRPFTTVLTSRGCKHGCSYCVQPYSIGISIRSVENIIEEIKELYFNFGVKCIRFTDDNFFASKQRIRELCSHLIDDDIKISWVALARIDDLDKDLCRLMKKAGCIRLDLGVESGSNRVLQYLNKGYNVDAIKKQVAMISSVGIQTNAKFIVGGEHEKDEDFEATLKLAKTLPFDFVEAMQIRFYPGTPLFDMQKKDIKFNLLPYHSAVKGYDSSKALSRERKFFLHCYCSMRHFKKLALLFVRYPLVFLTIAIQMFCYIINPYLLNTKRKDFA